MIRKFFLKRLLLIPLGILAFATTVYAQYNPGWVEHFFSLNVYPVVSSAIGFVPSFLSFSVAEWFTILFLLLVLSYVIFYIRKIVVTGSGGDKKEKKDSRGMIAYRGIAGLVSIGCVLYFAFTFLCGLNYYRYSFTHYTEYELEQYSVDELEKLCSTLAEEMSQERTSLGEEVDISTGDFGQYARYSVDEIRSLADQYFVFERPLYSEPKPVLMSGLMSDAGIGGIFFPFTMESNINDEAPFFTIPSTMTHELAHQCGFMREDEANFIAYLACGQSDDPLMRYSGYYLAFSKSISALYLIDHEKAEAILVDLPPAIQKDRTQSRDFWVQHEGFLTEVSRSTNDAYLKANNQSDGISSYGRMVDLLLAEQRTEIGSLLP